MEKPIALPAFEALPTQRDLVQITHWLQQAGLHELVLTNPQGLRLRLVASMPPQHTEGPSTLPPAPPAPVSSTTTAVVTPYFGYLRLQDHEAHRAFASVGQTVQKGQSVAMLDLGSITIAVPAPIDGVVASICHKEGDLVGYGQTILFISPP